MIKFGKQVDFSIYVDYEYLHLKDDPEFIKSLEHSTDYYMWGSMYFWVNGRNLFAFDDPDPKATYTYNMYIIFEFFTNFLQYQLIDDPFPVLTKAKNASAMLDEVSLVPLPDNDIFKYLDVDWDNVDMVKQSEIAQWTSHHCFTPDNDGSFLPDAIMRKVGDKIEYSWRDEQSFSVPDENLFLLHRQGVEYIDLKLYRDVIAEFCFDFNERFSHLNPERFEKQMQLLKNALRLFDEKYHNDNPENIS